MNNYTSAMHMHVVDVVLIVGQTRVVDTMVSFSDLCGTIVLS